jgi:hypothetical protein
VLAPEIKLSVLNLIRFTAAVAIPWRPLCPEKSAAAKNLWAQLMPVCCLRQL